MNPCCATPEPRHTTLTTPQPQPQHDTRQPPHSFHSTTPPRQMTQRAQNPIPSHLDQPTQQTTPTPWQMTRQTTIWQFIQQQLNQHMQINETEQRDTSQSSTNVSTDVESLAQTLREQLHKP